MKYLIANFKAETTISDITKWISEWITLLDQNIQVKDAIVSKKIEIIIAPPFPFLYHVQQSMSPHGIKTAAQNVSSFVKGKYTGEVTSEALATFASHVIIGHSERRSNFHESEEDIKNKIERAQESHITPILCVRGDADKIHLNIPLLAYEPVSSIGTGHNENPETVVAVKYRCNLSPNTAFLYGGSVDETNIKAYLDTNEIDGFLVGSASLHATQFMSLAKELL